MSNMMPEIPATILEQLGGAPRISFMIGIKLMTYTENTLNIRFKETGKSGINQVSIKLDPSDTYTVEFWKMGRVNATKVRSFDDIYADGLVDLFERETGLYLSIHPRR